jgi:hypothetical protein
VGALRILAGGHWMSQFPNVSSKVSIVGRSCSSPADAHFETLGGLVKLLRPLLSSYRWDAVSLCVGQASASRDIEAIGNFGQLDAEFQFHHQTYRRFPIAGRASED